MEPRFQTQNDIKLIKLVTLLRQNSSSL